MKGKLPLAVVACTTAKCTRAVPSQYWILVSLKIHRYRKPGLSCSTHYVEFSCHSAKKKSKAQKIQKKRRLVNTRQWKGSSMVHWTSTEAKGPREYWCKVFTPYILRSALWLKDWLPSAILSQVPWHRNLPLPHGLPEICSCMLSSTAKKGGAGRDGGMTMPRAAQRSERLGSQLVLLRLPCQRPMPKAILGYMAINLP